MEKQRKGREMTIEEAFKSLRKTYDFMYDEGDPTDHKAIQLGIEALELYYELRGCTAIDVEDIPSHLPSETEK